MPLLAHAAGQVGDPQVRHRGTIGGSIAHADPASDLPATTLALGATYVAQGPNGTREIAATDFYQTFFESALERRRDADRDPRAEDERRRMELPEVQPSGPGLGDRRRGGLAQRQRELRCRPRQHGGHTGARDERGGGHRRAGPAIADAAEQAAADAEPQADLNASVEYRQHLAKVLTRRALEAASA